MRATPRLRIAARIVGGTILATTFLGAAPASAPTSAPPKVKASAPSPTPAEEKASPPTPTPREATAPVQAPTATKALPTLLLDLQLGTMTNPLAGGLHAGVRLRRYYGHGRKPNLLFHDTYLEGEFALRGSPNVIIARAAMTWLPIQVLKLRIRYEGWAYTGFVSSYGTGLPLPTATTDIGHESLKAMEDNIVPGFGHRFAFEPELRAKLWRFIVVNHLGLNGLFVHGSKSYFFWEDGISTRGEVDLVIKNQAFLLFDVWQGKGVEMLYAGAYHEVYYSVRSKFRRQRVAGVVKYSPVRHWRYLWKPSLSLILGGHVDHPDRQGGVFFGFQLDIVVTPRDKGSGG